MIFNLFEILIILAGSLITIWGVNKYRERNKLLKEGRKRKLLVERRDGRRCVYCGGIGATLYDDKHGWCHEKCFRDLM